MNFPTKMLRAVGERLGALIEAASTRVTGG